MGDHFSAFSFVDRIHDYVPGERARATFAIPAHLKAFPSCLIAEAVGQLASWIAMAHIEFRGRAGAALALETRFLGGAQVCDRCSRALRPPRCASASACSAAPVHTKGAFPGSPTSGSSPECSIA